MIFALATLTVAATAQPKNEGQHKQKFERIKAEKIAFFTDKLDLSPEEAQVFWPIYNQYWKESQEAHKATMKAFGETHVKKDETISDKELEKKVDAYVKASTQEQSIMAAYYPKFKKVLPIGKVAKLYQAEEEFRMKMIRSLGNYGGGPRVGKMDQALKPWHQKAPETKELQTAD